MVNPSMDMKNSQAHVSRVSIDYPYLSGKARSKEVINPYTQCT